MKVAPSYRVPLVKKHLQLMDEVLVHAILCVVRNLKALPDSRRTWKEVVAIFKESSLFKADGDSKSTFDEFIPNTSSSWFKFGSNSDEPRCGIVPQACFSDLPSQALPLIDLPNLQVGQWFRKLLGNNDIADTTSINIEELGRMIAKARTSTASYALKATERQTETVLDIGILRYPDPENPYFEVCFTLFSRPIVDAHCDYRFIVSR